jgi:kynurenine formamidase
MSITNEPVEEQALVYPAIVERNNVKVSRSPWGPDDQIGRLNWITPESQQAVLENLNGSHVFDLSVEYFVGMPSWAAGNDPKYDIWLTHTPQGSIVEPPPGATQEQLERYTYSGDAMTMYTHCGTHIDTLNHAGHYGCHWNGWTADEHLGSRHWHKGGAENFPTIISRAVLIDVAAAHGVDCLPDNYTITPEELKKVVDKQGTQLRRGDVVLIRTGRMTRWPDVDGYLLNPPGINLASAKYLCEEVGAMSIGSDTVSVEVLPPDEPDDPDIFLPVHGYVMPTAGATLIEICFLEEVAAERVHEFAFIAGPLKLRGATGSPMRPIAIPLKD